MPRATLFHLSDLHLGSHPSPARAAALAESLCTSLTAARPLGPILLALTGDIFDSSHLDPAVVVPELLSLLDRLTAALGGPIPTAILPGNHDRRRNGLIGPFRGDLFHRLREALAGRPHVHVAGCQTPYLAELLPDLSRAAGASVVAYDSTHLPSGLISAGGAVHAEDLLQIAPRLDPDRPLILLTHHHLIPTPVTDVSRIDTPADETTLRALVQRALPRVVAFGDREELSMTAFGAGTALSMLHALERAVVVLHGHKHYPTARVLHATARGEGDIVLASAGSCGTSQLYEPTSPEESLRLWPSFNTVTLDAARIDVTTTFFSPTDFDAEAFVRPLISARREGPRWSVEPVGDPDVVDAPVALDEAVFALTPGRGTAHDAWDVTCARRVELAPASSIADYDELIEHARGAACEGDDVRPAGDGAYPRLHVRPGRVLAYRLIAGLCRALSAAERLRPGWSRPSFEWVGLLVRHRCHAARLVLRNLPGGAGVAFGSATDLATGKQRPIALRTEGDDVVLELSPSPARHLLRIHWPLERS